MRLRFFAHRSDDRAGRSVLFGAAQQIKLHPCDVMPAVVFPFDAPVQASVLEPKRSMKTVAGLVGLGDAGKGPPIAALREPAQ